MRGLIGIVAGVLLLALPSVAVAQVEHAAVSKTVLRVSDTLQIGDKTVQPGEYRFECKTIDNKHVMVVTSVEDGTEVARVPCTPVALDKKVDMAQYRSVRRNGTFVITEVRVKGEKIAHTIGVTTS